MFLIWDAFLWGSSEALSLRPWLRWQHTLAAASAGSSEYVVSWICHRQSVLSSSTYQWHSFPCNSTCSCDTMLSCKSHFSFLTDDWSLDNFGDIFFIIAILEKFHWLIVNLCISNCIKISLPCLSSSHKTTSCNYRIFCVDYYANINRISQ